MEYEALMVILGVIKAASNEQGIRSESCKNTLMPETIVRSRMLLVAIQPVPVTQATKERKR